MSSDKKYAERAMEIIHAWENVYVYDVDPTKRTNQGLNSDLVVSWAAPYFVNAAEILRYGTNEKPYVGWNAGETKKFITFINKFSPFGCLMALQRIMAPYGKLHIIRCVRG